MPPAYAGGRAPKWKREIIPTLAELQKKSVQVL